MGEGEVGKGTVFLEGRGALKILEVEDAQIASDFKSNTLAI